MVGQAVLNHGKYVQRRVGEVFKPVRAPVHCVCVCVCVTLRSVQGEKNTGIYPLPGRKSQERTWNMPLTLLLQAIVIYCGSHSRVARISKVTSWLFWQSFTKGNTIPGRYSVSPNMADQCARVDSALGGCTHSRLLTPHNPSYIPISHKRRNSVRLLTYDLVAN